MLVEKELLQKIKSYCLHCNLSQISVKNVRSDYFFYCYSNVYSLNIDWCLYCSFLMSTWSSRRRSHNSTNASKDFVFVRREPAWTSRCFVFVWCWKSRVQKNGIQIVPSPFCTWTIMVLVVCWMHNMHAFGCDFAILLLCSTQFTRVGIFVTANCKCNNRMHVMFRCPMKWKPASEQWMTARCLTCGRWRRQLVLRLQAMHCDAFRVIAITDESWRRPSSFWFAVIQPWCVQKTTILFVVGNVVATVMRSSDFPIVPYKQHFSWWRDLWQ